jgi:hypothetical protein
MIHESLYDETPNQQLDASAPRVRRQLNYYQLNDGSDEEENLMYRLPKKQRVTPAVGEDHGIEHQSSQDVLPEDSASQIKADPTGISHLGTETNVTETSRSRPATEWLWP